MADETRHSIIDTQDVIEDIDIRQFIAALWRNAWRIIILGIIGGLISVMVFLSRPIDFTAKAWVRIEPEITSAGETTHIDTEILIIKSWDVIATTVDTIGVTALVTREGSPLMQRLSGFRHGILSRLGLLAVDNRAGAVRHAVRLDVFKVPEEGLNRPIFLKVEKEGGYTLYTMDQQKILSAEEGTLVNYNPPSGIPMQIKVGEISAFRGEVFRITPLAREDYIKAVMGMMDADRTGIRNSNGIMEVSMKSQDGEFARRFLDVLTNVYVQQSLNRSSRGKIKMLAALRKRNEDVAAQLKKDAEALEAFRQKEKTVDLSAESQTKIAQLTEIQRIQLELKARRAEMQVTKTENHPSVVSLTQQIEFYQKQIVQIENELNRMPEIEKNLFQLTRAVELDKRVYEDNAVEIGKLTSEVSGLTGYAHTLGHALVQGRPFLIVMIIAGILGSGATVFVLVAIIFFRSTAIFSVIRTPDMLRMAAKLPVIAGIPRSQNAASKSKKPITVLLDSRERAAQILRDLEAKVKYITYGAGNNIILLTSDLEHQGKSFVAANFALLSANHRRTLLVDGDIVNGKLHENFASHSAPGFSDLIVGKVSIDEVLANPIEGKLWLIPAGTSVPSHSLLHDMDKMQEVMKELSKRFDLVVVDYPALVTQIDDPELLKFAGTIFLVVRQGERAARVKRFLAKYPQGLAKVSAVILNDMTKE